MKYRIWYGEDDDEVDSLVFESDSLIDTHRYVESIDEEQRENYTLQITKQYGENVGSVSYVDIESIMPL